MERKATSNVAAKKLIAFIKENKIFFLSLTILFIVLVYCSFNTFVANDDLAYSFFRRLNERVTNLFQVIWDNLRYYKSLNGRFIVHCIVMTLLIFGKNLWSILNPLVTVSLLGLIIAIISKNKKYNSKEKVVLALILPIMYLLLFEYKSLIYWVAGSINYLWVTLFIFIFIYLYLNKDLNKKRYYFLVFILSTLHENAFVFLLIFIIVLNLLEYIKNKKLTYLKFFIPVILGGSILLLAPGNINRTSSYIEWNSLNILEKLELSIPVVSNFSFKLLNLNNLVPTIYILAMLLKLFTIKTDRKYKIISIGVLLAGILLSFLNISNSTFILAIIAFIINIFIHYIEDDTKYIPIQVGFYAVAFSMIITPLYYFSRGSFSINFYFILISCKYILDIIESRKILTTLSIFILLISFIFLIYKEVDIYYHIGAIHHERLESIEKFKKQKESNVLYLKTIPENYSQYHIDANIIDENNFAYQYFIWYYELPDGTIIRYN